MSRHLSRIAQYRISMLAMAFVAVSNLVMYVVGTHPRHSGLNLAAGLFGLAMAGWYLYCLRQELRRVRRP